MINGSEGFYFQTAAILCHAIVLAFITFTLSCCAVPTRKVWFYLAKTLDNLYVVYFLSLAIVAVTPMPDLVLSVDVYGQARVDVLIAVMATYFISFVLTTCCHCHGLTLHQEDDDDNLLSGVPPESPSWNIFTVAEYFPVIYLYSLLVIGAVSVRLYTWLDVPMSRSLLWGTLSALLGIFISGCQYFAVVRGFGLSYYSPSLKFTPSLEQRKSFVTVIAQGWILFFSFFYVYGSQNWLNRFFFILLCVRAVYLFQTLKFEKDEEENNDSEKKSRDVEMKKMEGKDSEQQRSQRVDPAELDPSAFPRKLFASGANYWYSPVLVIWMAIVYIMISELMTYWDQNHEWYVFTIVIGIWWLTVMFVCHRYEYARKHFSLEVARHLGLFGLVWPLTHATKGVLPVVCFVLWAIWQYVRWARAYPLLVSLLKPF